MAVYQTFSARLCDKLRNAGLVVLLVLVFKGFVSMTALPSRQATIDTKNLRDPYSSSIATSDEMATKSAVTPSSDHEEIVEHDDDDGFVDTKSVDVDSDDEDQLPPVPEDEIQSKSAGPELLSLHLIGERHSGTKWMSAHLESCFPNVRFSNNPFRWKHWFQDEEIKRHPRERFVVVAQFRNPYTWTESMRSFPHHSPEHFHLDWPDFVTRTWTMPRYSADIQFVGWTEKDSEKAQANVCTAVADFLPHQVIPCMADRTTFSTRGIEMQALYELRNDGSGKPYDNILEMRKEKIENHLAVANYDRVKDFLVIRYEEAKLSGTSKLIAALEQALGQEAACKAEPGNKSFREHPIPKLFHDYLKENVHWETEAKIGYFPDDSY